MMIIGVNMGDAIPGVDFPRFIAFSQHGLFPFAETAMFYKFEYINQANADSGSCNTINPVLILD
ncbi:hypothetical protein WP50_15910, partial [Lactiplantibacillus plantarum]